MKYEECYGCYWKHNGECFRPKGEICIGRVGKSKRPKCANNLNGYCVKDYGRKCRPQGCPFKTDKVEYPIKEITKEDKK